MNENDYYEIIEESFNKFVKVNGTKAIKTALGIEIKDNNANYYIINKNDEFYDDFAIYKKDNLITLNINYFKNDELINEIKRYLKNLNYSYITTYIPIENKELIGIIKNNNDITISDETQNNYTYKKIVIKL